MNESFMYMTTTTNDDAINMFRTHFIMKKCSKSIDGHLIMIHTIAELLEKTRGTQANY